jgi:predicted molibdopterin-dependent oxidoreductase YjgC
MNYSHPSEIMDEIASLTPTFSGVSYAKQANVITSEYSDWATNCPEYKVTAVQISPSNGPSEWQKTYDEQARQSRRIAPVVEAAE